MARATDIMIDLETMGTKGTPSVVAIAAVPFFPVGEMEPWADFYENVDLASCLSAGLDIDGETVMWWLTKGDEARQSLTDPRPIHVRQAVDRLCDYLTSVGSRNTRGQPDFNLWCHGATFDVPILDRICHKLGVRPPWFFTRVRDTRTLYDLVGYKLPSVDSRVGGHNALADARLQVDGVRYCLSVIQQAVEAKE